MNRCHIGVYALVASVGFASPSLAQRVAIDAHPSPEARSGRVLSRLVTVTLDRVGLQDALRALAASAKVTIQFQTQDIRGIVKRITLDAKQRPLGAVLEQVLAGTNLQVVPFAETGVTIVPVVGDVVNTGGVAGVVTNAKTKQPMRGAVVALDDSGNVERTNESGQYRFADVLAGSHRITVRAIGFARQTKLIVVDDGKVFVANFALEGSVNTLDQVVVTATGAQRYRELGHVVTTINADSVVRDAPITSVSELLTGRVPGLQVLTSDGGVVGGEVALRIRGTSTASLDPQPIVIVDGVRYKNTNFTGQGEDGRPFSAEPRSPLNDLNVNDIEKVEIVKGPSASTLYGPDAANGVIVITTKRGQAGKPQWHVYSYPDLSTQSISSQSGNPAIRSLQGWGHVPGTTDQYNGQCRLLFQAAGFCVLDSVTVGSIASTDPRRSIIAKQRPQWHSGASVSGGNAGFLYFVSGNYDSQTGALRLPPEAEAILKSQLGVSTLPSAIKTPNTQQQVSLLTNISSQLTPTSSVRFGVNFTQVQQRTMNVGAFGAQSTSPAIPPGASASDSLASAKRQLQTDAFLNTTQQNVRRLTANLGGALQPAPWFDLNASVATDIDYSTDAGVRPSGSTARGDVGEADIFTRINTNRNATLRGTATRHSDIWSFRTSLGIDYSYMNLDGLNTQGRRLAPGSTDITTASQQSVSRLWNETASLGGYGEEVVGVRDRLFLTASVRVDGSTSFGDAYTPRPYPKIGLSWIASEEPFLRPLRNVGLDELRLRYSFGSASRYPTSAMKIGQLFVSNGNVEGVSQTTVVRTLLANADLQPERSRETEYGADATIASNLQIGLTWHRGRTNEQLQLLNVPNGFLSEWANVGDLSTRGFEATAQLKAFESSRATLNLAFSYSYQTNKVLSLGSASEVESLNGSIVPGYPLNSAFGSTTIAYADTATQDGLFQPGDGYIVDPSEVVSSPIHYLGDLIAPRTYTFSPSLLLWGGRFRIAALVDGQSGGIQFSPISYYCAHNLTCSAAFLKPATLLEQAKLLAIGNVGDGTVSSNFTRWRELSVTGDLPLTLRQRLHLSRASASVQVRNLALWTSSLAPDVESVSGLGTVAVGGPYGASGIPQPRSWTIRFDVSP